jgi:hypothetical protein
MVFVVDVNDQGYGICSHRLVSSFWLAFMRNLYAFQMCWLHVVSLQEAGLEDSIMFFLSDDWWLIC